ncbi:Bodo-specific multi-copy gene family, putative [Bodo saltans]|uniref:Bodo-specific multi-copy gene family, putative n=1 Tax=Bodo saltans TaxID=75058 RepID=A0A0S4JLY5_BODSA|nr:Bodo-specific multi-copy gene family, putative [Bodo saltans]|eukprot:CUG92547.1 Bodo-specific multi-copy gene family, putative [Bodo saltans]
MRQTLVRNHAIRACSGSASLVADRCNVPLPSSSDDQRPAAPHWWRPNTRIKYFDATAWPKHWSATEIEGLVKKNLLDLSAPPPNYNSLASLLHMGDIDAINVLVRDITAPPSPTAIDVKRFLETCLHNAEPTSAVMLPLQERVSTTLDRALALQTGSNKRNIGVYSAPQGSGKTQLVKSFVEQKRAEAMKCGRVIVRCCKNDAGALWMTRVLEEDSTTSSNSPNKATTNSVQNGLCELIRSHVEFVTGCPQRPSHYANPQTAYATWISETARCFKITTDSNVNVDPLIVLDTCEFLAQHSHKTLVHKPSQTPYTLLEALCLSVPSPHSIFAVGCGACSIDTTDPVMLAIANVRDVSDNNQRHKDVILKKQQHNQESKWSLEVELSVNQ